MWLSTRVDNVDSNRATKRGPSLPLEPFISGLFRLGFLLQCLSSVGLIFVSLLGTGSPLFNYHIIDSKLLYGNYSFYVALCYLVGIIGALYIMTFQVLMADDACWARGYVAASKVLKNAIFADIMGKIVCFVFALEVYYDSEANWQQALLNGGVEINFLTFGHVMSGLGALGYSLALFLLEVYQDEGAGEAFAYWNGLIFSVGGFTILYYALTWRQTGAALFIAVAYFSAFIWASIWEPEVNELSPSLSETELTNDVETQVEKFTRSSPYYNAEEAMAHGGVAY